MVSEYRKDTENVHFLPLFVLPISAIPPLAAITIWFWWSSNSFRTL